LGFKLRRHFVSDEDCVTCFVFFEDLRAQRMAAAVTAALF
jgi:hypothetical protein